MRCSPPSARRARIDYLVCSDEVCVPEQADVAVELRVGEPGPGAAAFDGFRRALPRPLGGEGRFAVEGGRLRLAIPLPAGIGVDDPHFFAATTDAVGHSAPQAI